MSRKAIQTSPLPFPLTKSERASSQAAPTVMPTALPAALSPPPTSADSGVQVIEADIDGRRVRIVAKDEIVLECGQASVTLRRNGRIIIRGTYVETHSEGTNRIKGGQVRIN